MKWLKSLLGLGRDRELEGVFERIRRLMTEDDEQNRFLPPWLEPRFGTSVDAWPGGQGPFGRSPDNPIPVNGPLGEVLYLSQLRTPRGVPLLFHRIDGLRNNVDRYELVSLDGSHWDVLYLDMYHLRKSSLTPNGLTRDTTLRTYPFIFGVSSRVQDFPGGLLEAVSTAPTSKLLLPVKPSLITEALAKHTFRRPADHARALAEADQPSERPAHLDRKAAYPMGEREFPTWFPQVWSAAGRYLESRGGERMVWLRMNLNPPVVEHLSFRLGSQLYFVWVELNGEPALQDGIRSLFLAACSRANAHPCVLPMARGPSGYAPREGDWGLLDVPSNRPVDPDRLDLGQPVEMSEWEVHDFGVQTVADWLSEHGARNISRQSNLGVDPSIWFERDRGPEYVVVRAVRYPQMEAQKPENLEAVAQRSIPLSRLGHFASVSVAADAQDERRGRLLRGAPMMVRFTGLEPIRVRANA